MKIRITTNNVRFRLGRGEVDSFAAGNQLVEKIHVGKNELIFRLTIDSKTSIDENTLHISIPLQQVKKWANGDEVGIALAAGELQILIEKDFKCLHSPTENQADCFPNPLEEITR